MSPVNSEATRGIVLYLKATGISNAEITHITGYSQASITQIYKKACDKGFNPEARPLNILNEYVRDAPRSGRPSKTTPENINKVTSLIKLDRYAREKTCHDLSNDLKLIGIRLSAKTIYNILKAAGFKKTKPTRKPGLTKAMKEARLQFCLEHKDWTDEDWKNVIWSDETSVILSHRRGSYKVWRQPDERFLKSVVRPRWKGASEFMF